MRDSAAVRSSLFAVAALFAIHAPCLAVDVVIGNGTPASCTEAALDAAIATIVPVGGNIAFNCGGAHTITVTSQKVFEYAANSALSYGIDGGGLITLSGDGATRLILHRSGSLAIANISLSGGRATGARRRGERLGHPQRP